jgi:flagellar basal-body rod protein FlgF
MQYGMYIAASGAMSSMFRQNVAANNLANLSTAGFKVDMPMVRQRDPVRDEDGLHHLPSNQMLEALGAGVQGLPNHIRHSQGVLSESSNMFDMAIQGDGFFVVRSGTDQTGDSQRLTRDGRFTLNRDGMLVTQDGLPVLARGNRTITLRHDQPVLVGTDGSISQGGARVAQLQVLDVADRQALRKVGASSFTAPTQTMMNALPATGLVRQGAIEQSTVDPISAMLAVQGAGRDVESNIGMISRYDTLMDRAINTFARVA